MKATRLAWILLLLLLGNGCKEKAVSSITVIRAKAEKGDAVAQYNLGWSYANGRGVATNDVEAVKWYRMAADQNYALAQSSLGRCYGNGQGVTKNEAEAVKWFRRAAAQNDAKAQYSLGRCYGIGKGVTKDETEAVKWFRKAAAQNNADAQYSLGWHYANGRGVATNEVQALKCLRKAAEQNDASAQLTLGWYYQHGRGTATDYVEAYKWSLLASEQGHRGAKQRLVMVADWMTPKQIAEGQELARSFKTQQVPASGGDGNDLFITEDVSAGFQLPTQQSDADRKLLAGVRAKAEMGDAQSQYELGRVFAFGRLGVSKDEAAAVGWFRKAAESGEIPAFTALAWILATSPNSDIRDGSNAVVFAEKAVAATNRKIPAELDTLAAAYAETGQFEKAASTQQEAIALMQTEGEKNEYRTRLKRFELHLPYRVND